MSELALQRIAENKAKHARGEEARVLDLGYCRMTKFPDEVGELIWLETLKVYNTQWADFELRQGLDKYDNLLNEIPDLIGQLKNLRSLEWNRIGVTMEQDFQFLKKLTKLELLDFGENNLSNGNLQKIGDALNGHQNLKTLIISGNYFVSDLTPLLHLIKKGLPVHWFESELTKVGYGICVYSCKLGNPSIEVVRSGNAAILNYFAERSKQQFKNTEIKLIFVGNSTVGKTSLSRYLREQQYDHKQSTTHGIQNFRWEPQGHDLLVNCWDFGGQEYYHATHRLFMSRNAIYVLVWDAKTDKGGVDLTEIHYENDPQTYTVPLEHFSKEWWLKNIHFYLNKYTRHEREGNATIPVLFVQNKCAAGEGYEIQDVPNEFGNAPFHLPAKWRNHHIDLAAVAKEQANDKQGEWTMRFKIFKNELIKTLENQMATYEFAVYHRDIRDRVWALASGDSPVNEMPWVDFESMCRDIESDAKMDLVLIYLRDITGDILYFDQNERLGHRVFLRPDWVCNRIYAILSRKVLEREGLFDVVWVREALQCNEKDALDFVELMCEFQLVFKENDNQGNPTGVFVAPQYLPETCTRPGELDGAKKYASLNHAFTLWYPDFLPKSHIARFVAHWGYRAKQRLFWKNGLLFQTDGCSVLVERNEEFKIRVDIQTGKTANRQKALWRVFRSFLDLEDGQAGFAISLDEQNFVKLSEVQKAMKMQARKVEVYTPEISSHLVDLKPFFVFHKPDSMAKKVFISYSHKDEAFKEELDLHLSALKREGLAEVWHDRRIEAGTEWDEQIKLELESADLILLLVSANFLASKYIWEVEIAHAMERHRAKEARVIPIFIRFCDVKGMPFEGIQGLPRDAKPVASFTDKDEAYLQIAKGIRAILET